MSAPVNRFLAVKWQVVAVFADDDLCKQAGSYETAFQERVGQWRDHRHGIEFTPPNIFWAHRASTQEPGRFVVQPFTNFFSDAPPELRRVFDRLRHNLFFDYRQMLGQARSA